MEKYIYKITNKINGKSYIGQTTNYQRRFREHRNKGYGEEPNKPLYNAFDKYGIDNFDFEVIEDLTENYNEREKYWIQYYNTLLPNGYNIEPGGEEPPLNIGENSPYAEHTKQQIEEIKELLKNTDISFEELAKKYNYSVSSILKINNGKIWFNQNNIYPIRVDKRNKRYYSERALLIIDDLLNTTLTQKEIAKKYGVSRSCVTMINIGENNRQSDLTYPLRK